MQSPQAVPPMTPTQRRRTLAYPMFVAVAADFLLGGRALRAEEGWVPLALIYLTLWAMLFRFAFTGATSREKWLGVPLMTLGLYGSMWSMRQLYLYDPNSVWWAFGGTFASVILVSVMGELLVRPRNAGSRLSGEPVTAEP